MKYPSCCSVILLTMAPFAKAALTNYWPLNETTGGTAPNSAAGGTAAALSTGLGHRSRPRPGARL
ncbi:MAG: hypothetical protein V4726_10000 [Verrucomicrobiota bacterium]